MRLCAAHLSLGEDLQDVGLRAAHERVDARVVRRPERRQSSGGHVKCYVLCERKVFHQIDGSALATYSDHCLVCRLELPDACLRRT